MSGHQCQSITLTKYLLFCFGCPLNNNVRQMQLSNIIHIIGWGLGVGGRGVGGGGNKSAALIWLLWSSMQHTVTHTHTHTPDCPSLHCSVVKLHDFVNKTTGLKNGAFMEQDLLLMRSPLTLSQIQQQAISLLAQFTFPSLLKLFTNISHTTEQCTELDKYFPIFKRQTSFPIGLLSFYEYDSHQVSWFG